MAKPKVYATRIGFHDAVVAAPNQKAALAAWDVREDLFAQGAAHVADDPQAVAAALAEPGVVLRRPAGSDGPFSATPGLPRVPDTPRPNRKAKAAQPVPKPAPDRRPLERAEAELAAFEQEADARRRDLEDRRRNLEDEARAAERELAARRRALQQARDQAARDYARAGGR